MLKIELIFDNENIKQSEIIYNGFILTEKLHNNLKNVDDDLSIKIPYNTEIADCLKRYEKIKARLIDENNVIFAGYLRNNFKFQKEQKNLPIQLEIVSPSFLIKKKLNEVFSIKDETLSYIIETLLNKVDLKLSNNSKQILSSINMKYFFYNSENINTVIEELLLEVGYLFKFNKNYELDIYSIYPEVVNSSFLFNGENIRENLTIEKKEENYKGISLNYTKIEEATETPEIDFSFGDNEHLTIFSDTTTEDDKKGLLETLKTKEAYNYTISFPNDFYVVLCDSFNWTVREFLTTKYISLNNYLTNDSSFEIDFINKKINLNLKIKESYKKFFTFSNLKIKFNNAFLENGKEFVKIDGENPLEKELKYLHTFNNASYYSNRLANKLYNYYRFSDFKATLKSKDNLNINDIVKIQEYNSGELTGRIIEKKTDFENKIYTYVIEGLKEAVSAEIINEEIYSSKLNDGFDVINTWYSSEELNENSFVANLSYIENGTPKAGDTLISNTGFIFDVVNVNTNNVGEVLNISIKLRLKIKGEKGDKGEQGIQGIQGIKGDKGEQGIQGEKGDTGATGAKGDKGDKGEQGIQGVKGDKGDKGEQGVRGSLEFSGTEIDHIGTTDKAYTITTSSNGITSSSMPILVGDTYINTTSQDVWTCTTAGTPTTAKWKYQGRRCSDKDNTNVFRLFTPKTDYGSLSGSTLSKQVVKGVNPFGEISDLLKITNTNGAAVSNYAPNYKAHKIDPKKTYRYVAYIKQEDANYTDYFGLQRYITSRQYIGALSTGTATSAAYFTSATNFGTLGRWYMVVGYVVANGTTTAPADSGVYDMTTKQKVRSVTNFQWLSTATAILQMGTLIRYTGSNNTTTGTAYLYDVRLDEIDGTEPTLNELLNLDTTTKSKGTWKASTIYNTGDIVYLNGNSYICIKNHTSGTSFSTTNWNLIASKGDKGDKGDTGATGAKGDKGDKGDKGATGAQGIQGIQGAKGDKGDKGDQGIQGVKGQRGGMYKGAFTSAPTSGIVPEDFYLNKNDGYIYLYNGSTWKKITDYTDSKYLQAMNDMISISNTSTNNSLITATNAHIENLATRNILANKIATQTINLNNNGLIKSNNYVSGESGFQIDSNGNAEFNSGRFRGGIGYDKFLDSVAWDGSSASVKKTLTGSFSFNENGSSYKIQVYTSYSASYGHFPLADLEAFFTIGKGGSKLNLYGSVFDEKLIIENETLQLTFKYPGTADAYGGQALYIHIIKY